MFLDKFKALVPKYLEDDWREEEDGIPADVLNEMLDAHDFAIPLVLREFYLALGNNEDLMEAFHFFWDPDELEIEDGYLLFLEDEDEKFAWGFRVDQLDVPDPLSGGATMPAATGRAKKEPSASTFLTCSSGSLRKIRTKEP